MIKFELSFIKELKKLIMKHLLLVFLLTSIFLNNYNAQSNGCGSPPNLPVNTTCSTQSFAQNQNGTGNEEINASCATAGTAYSDAWYTATGTGNTMTITVTNTTHPYALSSLTS